jgi:hypothetical protein
MTVFMMSFPERSDPTSNRIHDSAFIKVRSLCNKLAKLEPNSTFDLYCDERNGIGYTAADYMLPYLPSGSRIIKTNRLNSRVKGNNLSKDFYSFAKEIDTDNSHIIGIMDHCDLDIFLQKSYLGLDQAIWSEKHGKINY